MRKAIVIGLTGQTGAGKTTVAEGLRHFGYQVIKADEIGSCRNWPPYLAPTS